VEARKLECSETSTVGRFKARDGGYTIPSGYARANCAAIRRLVSSGDVP
jgi:hypothetical protein